MSEEQRQNLLRVIVAVVLIAYAVALLLKASQVTPVAHLATETHAVERVTRARERDGESESESEGALEHPVG